MELVSAIITTHNRFELLTKAIDSVLNQNYKNIECIVIDDSSDEDYSKELFLKYGEKIKFRRIEKSDSKGGNYARNVGIKMARGEYIAFLDDDDEWYESKIKRQVEYITKHPKCGLVYCGRLLDYIDYTEPQPPCRLENFDCSKFILYNIICTTSTMLCKKTLVDKIGGFDERLKFWQEYDLTIRMCQIAEVGYVDDILVKYRIDKKDKNRLTNKYDEWWKAVHYHNEKYSDLIEQLTNKEKVKRQNMILYDALHRAESINQKKEMKRILFKIFRLSPNFKNLIAFILGLTPEKIGKIYRLLGRKK